MLNRLAILAVLIAVAISGCSSNRKVLEPTDEPRIPAASESHLSWGTWQFTADPGNGTLEAVQLRTSDMHLNALPFLEPPALLNLTLESVIFNGNIVEVDIGLKHPFLGLTEFTGFDVCGVLITDGSVSGFSDTHLVMTGAGDTRLLNADGVTRWWNPAEFPHGNTMLSYKDGLLGTSDAKADYNSTLNAYKYFCDDLGANDPLSDVTLAKRGMFSAGKKNIRHYSIDMGTGLVFNYAVDACWKFPEGTPPYTAPDDFPPKANRSEAWRVKVNEVGNTLWNDGSDSGGGLSLAIDVYDWFSAGLNKMRVESPGNFTKVESNTPAGGGAGYSTYEVEIVDATPAAGHIDLLLSVISEEENFEGFINGTNTTAYFVYTANVAAEIVNTPPVITGITDDIPPDGLNTTVGASDTSVTYIALYDDPDIGQMHTVKWYIEDASATGPTEPPDSMPYNWAPKAPGDYKIWVKVSDGYDEETGGPYIVTRVAPGWARTWGGPSGWDQGWDITMDASGNIYVSGMFTGNVDFDPGSGQNYHTATGSFDAFVSKFDASGNFVWARTWGGTNEDWAKSVFVSGSYLYVSGYFRTTVPGEQVDFDPDPAKTAYRTSNGDRDAFISQFDLNGTFNWVQTWGTANYEWGGEDLVCDSSNNVYSLGWNEGPWRIDLRSYNTSGVLQWSRTWLNASVIRMEDITIDGTKLYFTGLVTGSNLDFDPGPGTTNISTGVGDAILCCFDTSGNFQWVKNWGTVGEIWAQSVACDPSGYIYIGGTFTGVNVDFDPGPDTEFHSSSDGSGNRDCFLTKFDSTGSHEWAKTWGGVGNEDWTKGVACDSSGNAYVTGYYRSASCNLDPDGSDYRSNAGWLDVFLSKFDSTGDYIWGRNIGGTGIDYGTDLVVGSGSIFYIGVFSSYNMDFDPGSGTDYHSTNGSEDIFLSKISTDGSW